MESCKIYVDVNATFTKDGRLLPRSFIWTDGHRYEIQRIKHKMLNGIGYGRCKQHDRSNRNTHTGGLIQFL